MKKYKSYFTQSATETEEGHLRSKTCTDAVPINIHGYNKNGEATTKKGWLVIQNYRLTTYDLINPQVIVKPNKKGEPTPQDFLFFYVGFGKLVNGQVKANEGQLSRCRDEMAKGWEQVNLYKNPITIWYNGAPLDPCSNRELVKQTIETLQEQEADFLLTIEEPATD